MQWTAYYTLNQSKDYSMQRVDVHINKSKETHDNTSRLYLKLKPKANKILEGITNHKTGGTTRFCSYYF